MGRRRVSKTPNKKKLKEGIAGGAKEEGKARQVPWSLISVVLICLVGVIAYFNSFDCSFHFDDTSDIVDNIAIRFSPM